MRVLVTGGAGFIGSHLVDALLARGDDVRILDSLDPQVHDGVPAYLSMDAELVVGDVRDREAVRRCLDGCDRLVHFAAAVGVGQSMYEIERYTSVNAIGCAVVLEEATAARDRLEKVVVASSMSIYGEGAYRCPAEGVDVLVEPRPEEQLVRREWEPRCPACGTEVEPLPTAERKPLQPTSIYAIGKRDHEEMTLAWSRAYRVPATALRFFNVYGPRQALSNPYTGVGAIFASRLLNDRPPVVFEDGRQTRDFVRSATSSAASCSRWSPEPPTGPLSTSAPGARRACSTSPPHSAAGSARRSSRRSATSSARATSGTAMRTSRSPATSWASSPRSASRRGWRSWPAGSPAKRPKTAAPTRPPTSRTAA